MAISTYLRKEFLPTRLSRGRTIPVAGKTYQMKGFFLNTLALEVLNHFVIGTGTKLDDQHIRFRESRFAKMEDLLRHREYEIYNLLEGNRMKDVRKIVLGVTNNIAVSKGDVGSSCSFPGAGSDS
jgi:hypothetical protein